jgi:hypothetical protein
LTLFYDFQEGSLACGGNGDRDEHNHLLDRLFFLLALFLPFSLSLALLQLLLLSLLIAQQFQLGCAGVDDLHELLPADVLLHQSQEVDEPVAHEAGDGSRLVLAQFEAALGEFHVDVEWAGQLELPRNFSDLFSELLQQVFVALVELLNVDF